MIGEKHLHALTHKGSADDGKRFSSDGRCICRAEAFFLDLGGGVRGGGGSRSRGVMGWRIYELLILAGVL